MSATLSQPRASSSLREQVSSPNPLSFYDTLHKTVRPFELQSGQDVLRWYSCGPTVYDASHMGHARNYVTTDILRRIVSDYFGFRVRYVQNITDVDDKIIVKARHNLLFEKYTKLHASDWLEQIDTIKTWWQEYRVKSLAHVECSIEEWQGSTPQARDINKFPKDQMAIDTLSSSASALLSAKDSTTAEDFFRNVRDIVIFGIDSPDQTIANDEIFKSSRDLTTYWEAKFDEDMNNLNVLKPDKVVRVTEYMDVIIDFVKAIIKNGFAYEVNGSVYFNVAQFISSGHDYAKLKPSSMNSSSDALIAEAEGSLSSQIAQAKKSQRDFALWKASKSGEPYWPSPWGQGRPGWHIECSAMASSEFGHTMDIHSGGEDLTFPHHDNELAQSEAAHGCHEWVRYFLHTGHLHIHGMKMSKSLKNFITIEEVLTTEGMTSRTMRLLFLSGKWRGRVDYNDDLIKGVRNTEQKFSEFFAQIRALDTTDSDDASQSSVQNRDESLAKRLQDARDDVDLALSDDFDTPRVLSHLRDLLSEANKALSCESPPIAQLTNITKFLTSIFEVFGIDAAEDRIGWSQGTHSKALMHEVQGVAEYRQQIRELAIKSFNTESLSALNEVMSNLQMLDLSTPELQEFRRDLQDLASRDPQHDSIMNKLDDFRDYTLVDLGIALDDKKDSFILKSSTREELISKREQKLAEAAEKAAKKEETKRKETELMMRGKTRASDYFRDQAQYTKFDARGVPTHTKDENGEEIEVSKSLGKKLAKEYAAQEKLNKKYDDWVVKQ